MTRPSERTDQPDPADRALAAAEELGLDVTATRHVPAAVPDPAAGEVDPARVIQTKVVQVSESDVRFVLLPGDRDLSWPKVQALIGVDQVSTAPADLVSQLTGYPPDAVTPLGSLTPLPVIADERIDATVTIGGGTHGVGLAVDAAALLAALNALASDVTDPRET